jgi:hypothetical protein
MTSPRDDDRPGGRIYGLVFTDISWYIGKPCTLAMFCGVTSVNRSGLPTFILTGLLSKLCANSVTRASSTDNGLCRRELACCMIHNSPVTGSFWVCNSSTLPMRFRVTAAFGGEVSKYLFRSLPDRDGEVNPSEINLLAAGAKLRFLRRHGKACSNVKSVVFNPELSPARYGWSS